MNPRKAFNFKVKEVIGYIEHYDGEEDDPIINSVDIYLSGGQVVTLDLKDNPTNLCKSNLKSEVKSTYNPYE
jgi:hypothetical protein